MIKITGLTKKFGDTVAVDNLTLTISRGEFFTLLGPNGAGKTTTLKIIAGLLRPTSGQVFVDKYDIASKKYSIKKIISYIPDVPYVYEKLTGREFLYFIGELYHLERNVYREEAERLLSLFHIQDSGDIMMENYSHGMRQKVVISSALLHNPKLIIIDEPMVGLDPRSVRLVKDILQERTFHGTTICMATHTLSLAEEVADRIGIIHNGKLISLGTVAEIKKVSKETDRLEDVFLKITAEA